MYFLRWPQCRRHVLPFVFVIAYGLVIPACGQSLPSGIVRNIKIGDLGGLKVEIPTNFASIVEYDGDPWFGERRRGSVPVRSYESPISGMFFEFRFPDMAFLSTPELRADKRSTSPEYSFWMHGLITSGGNYPGSGGLGRYKDALISTKSTPYRELKAPTLGLQHFTRLHPDPESEKYSSGSDEDVYVGYDASGTVDTLITCSARTFGGRLSLCEHEFNLPGARATVSVTYRRGLMDKWREIQKSLTSTILGFAVEK